MQYYIILRPETARRWRAFAVRYAESFGNKFIDTSKELADGSITFNISKDVHDGLERLRAPGMSDDALIESIIDAENAGTLRRTQ
jgi:hypothetical protein